MAIKTVLVHRYNNKPDVLAVEKNGCSDVMKASSQVDFDLVLVIPTGEANTDIAVLADPTSAQYKVRDRQKHWPGSPGKKYVFRVDLANVRYTSLQRVRQALIKVGQWDGQWTVKSVQLDDCDLLESEPDIESPEAD
jgi:hypothetical protein